LVEEGGGEQVERAININMTRVIKKRKMLVPMLQSYDIVMLFLVLVHSLLTIVHYCNYV